MLVVCAIVRSCEKRVANCAGLLTIGMHSILLHKAKARRSRVMMLQMRCIAVFWEGPVVLGDKQLDSSTDFTGVFKFITSAISVWQV